MASYKDILNKDPYELLNASREELIKYNKILGDVARKRSKRVESYKNINNIKYNTKQLPTLSTTYIKNGKRYTKSKDVLLNQIGKIKTYLESKTGSVKSIKINVEPKVQKFYEQAYEDIEYGSEDYKVVTEAYKLLQEQVPIKELGSKGDNLSTRVIQYISRKVKYKDNLTYNQVKQNIINNAQEIVNELQTGNTPKILTDETEF